LQACLEPSTAEGKVSSVFIECDNNEEFIIANLNLKNFNENIDLAFNEGEKICFKVDGPGTVHLTGNLLQSEEDGMNMMEDSDSSSDDEEENVHIAKSKKAKVESESEEDESDEVDSDESEESSYQPKVALKKDEPELNKAATEVSKVQSSNKDTKADLQAPKKDVKTPKLEDKAIKQDKQTPSKTPKKDAQTPVNKPKTTLKSGMIIEDLVMGTGQVAKKGNGVGMYYKGWLKSNNKKFDACLTGKPFKFKLGARQVITGWDLGVAGMKVGGKRRLTIPAPLGYGGSGAPPDIPPNATLVFDVECKFVKVYGGNNVL
jgi:FK506-binding nuclear protein